MKKNYTNPTIDLLETIDDIVTLSDGAGTTFPDAGVGANGSGALTDGSFELGGFNGN